MLPRKILFSSLAAALFLPGVARGQQQQASPQRPRSIVPLPDCNLNGVEDALDIALGTSADCNANRVPDECDIGEVTLLAESFERGLPAGWSASGIAHVTDQCPRLSTCDGPNFVYFGLDATCNFEFGFQASGGLVLPGVRIPASAVSAKLTFCSAYEGEGQDPYDTADVYVNGALVDHVSPLAQLDWETRTIDLSHLIGQSASIVLDFNAMDAVANEFLGWQVDNIRLSVGVGAGGADDCDLNGVPDECDPDCNASGLPDPCDIAAGTADDCNLNGVPDACDLASSTSVDCNLNAIPDECDLLLDLTGALSNLETTAAVITSYFPDTQNFPGGEEGQCIEFDFLGTFDCASTLNTNLASGIAYTASSARPEAGFGPAGQYFTAKYPGLFTMVATGCSIDTFAIGGNNGPATGAATVDELELSVQVASQPYTIYVKRVHGSGNVSVNQVIAIPGDGAGVTHSFATNPLESAQMLDGLAGIDRIYYMLVCRRIPGEAPPPLRPIDAQEMVRELVASCPGPLSTDDDGNGIPDECD